MRQRSLGKVGLGCVIGGVGAAAVTIGVVSCGTAPTPFLVQGPGSSGNTPPVLTFVQPVENLTKGRGSTIPVEWTDRDPDDNATISFSLENKETSELVLLISGIPENPDPDSRTVDTSLIPLGLYNIFAIIDDGTNAPVKVVARTAGTDPQAVEIRIVGAGEGSLTEPPAVAATGPSFDLSVTQDDTFRVTALPDPLDAAAAFDRDSDVTVWVVFDLDQIPDNDIPDAEDPVKPDPSKVIVVFKGTINTGAVDEFEYLHNVDLTETPPRTNGEPYFVRVTLDDGDNPPVHSYAAGRINIVKLASEMVDLAEVGNRISGARFYGFNPGANLGSRIAGVTDFDADGADDFVMVAQFGNPQGVGNVGEAYLVYGQVGDDGGSGNRFGGTLSANAVSGAISGVIFQGPPVRTQVIPDDSARTDGIVDVGVIQDVTGDGRPELLFGLSHVHGAFDSTDDDPEDSDDDLTFCYPDSLVNNESDGPPRPGEDRDLGWFAGGIAVVVNSQNRDSDPSIRGANGPTRLDTTSVALELSGMAPRVLDGQGVSATGNILPRADNDGVVIPAPPETIEPEEPGRIAGARFVTGPYDHLFKLFPARQGLFGHRVGSIGDLTQDGTDEYIVSAPMNERYLADLAKIDLGFQGSLLASTIFEGSITVFPGDNYNRVVWRDLDEDGTSRIPYLDADGPGNCTGNPPLPRSLIFPAAAFSIFAEDIDDWLTDGQSAGDFNQDGIADILCGARKNDRTANLADTGASYIIYGRSIVGDIRLINANNASIRPPMIRIRSNRTGDQIGWAQTSARDVNGDQFDDIFISSPTVDGGFVTRTTCGIDFNGDSKIDQNDFALVTFEDCIARVGGDLFTNDSCSAFDYDLDGDIDDDDRCVFCCLSDDCVPDASCVHGKDINGGPSNNLCCTDMVNEGFVGVIFGGRFLDGDRTITQIGTTDLPGAIFRGGNPGDRAGMQVNSAGDFNQDGFGDLLIVAPGEVRKDSAGRDRLGVVYLVFGDPRLMTDMPTIAKGDQQDGYVLSDSKNGVGSDLLPGIVFLSPYVKGTVNEAAPIEAVLIGDINNDGFDDIAIGNPRADFIDLTFPQGPNAPGNDPSAGRRRNAGDVYIVYGSNFGKNQ